MYHYQYLLVTIIVLIIHQTNLFPLSLLFNQEYTTELHNISKKDKKKDTISINQEVTLTSVNHRSDLNNAVNMVNVVNNNKTNKTVTDSSKRTSAISA